MKQVSTYYFNPQVALYDALHSENSVDTLFFYDGVFLQEAPLNCINVPIGTFFDYFSKTIHPQIIKLNFDGVGFSDDTKEQIAQSITQAIDSIKKQKEDIVNTFLDTDVCASNLNVMLLVFLQYVRDNEEPNKDIILKLLTITIFFKEHILTIEPIIIELSTSILKHLQRDKNIFNIHLNYALELIQGLPLKEVEAEYFKLLSEHQTILDIIQNFVLIKTIFNQDRFKEYIEKFSLALFDDNFFESSTLEQKKKIFKLYYLSVLKYNRSRDYIAIYKVLYPIFEKAIQRELDELIFYMYTPLLMSWDETAPSQDGLKEFNDKIEKPIENLIKSKLIKKYDLKPNKKKIDNSKKIKVAFLIDRVIPYSIYNVFYSLLESLSKAPTAEYEFIIYNLNFIESGSLDETVQELKELGFKYVDLHKEYVGDEYPFYEIIEKTLKVRDRLIEEKIDMIIGFNSRPEYNFLFTTRTAPKQIYWSHGNNEYDLENIDKKIAHGSIGDRLDFDSFSINMEEDYYNPHVDMNEVKKIKDSYPKDSFILGTIGRLIKIEDDEYLQTVASIMKKNPQTIYLACGSGKQESIKKRIEQLGISDRFFFPGYIDTHVYGHVIDLWLEPFKISNGESLNEYMYKNRPYIALWNEWSEKDKLKESYLYDKYVWPYSIQNYIDVADELINNKELVEFVLEKRKPINEEALKQINKTFLDAIKD
ncbi:hypothetical protein Suden_0201 [Sulfurimonas denitrificans DSM 1251]|uniref:Uncharacterized protein n=1 Tax=Sulfurimonas denitrificans (strain ATCC 33889 / DSM 1251) TaxID=326298 RepID=Q30U49_SULDN|nr:hypothetical protein [Sulfurimonas denitrificans]ABB43482.1 hypothetical protein Suden_0201 [Sulfurimonas denitrificans DSM 1251]MDD3443315.1 hypothetical protein [Sulfurimonas denitrificans]